MADEKWELRRTIPQTPESCGWCLCHANGGGCWFDGDVLQSSTQIPPPIEKLAELLDRWRVWKDDREAAERVLTEVEHWSRTTIEGVKTEWVIDVYTGNVLVINGNLWRPQEEARLHGEICLANDRRADETQKLVAMTKEHAAECDRLRGVVRDVQDERHAETLKAAELAKSNKRLEGERDEAQAEVERLRVTMFEQCAAVGRLMERDATVAAFDVKGWPADWAVGIDDDGEAAAWDVGDSLAPCMWIHEDGDEMQDNDGNEVSTAVTCAVRAIHKALGRPCPWEAEEEPKRTGHHVGGTITEVTVRGKTYAAHGGVHFESGPPEPEAEGEPAPRRVSIVVDDDGTIVAKNGGGTLTISPEGVFTAKGEPFARERIHSVPVKLDVTLDVEGQPRVGAPTEEDVERAAAACREVFKVSSWPRGWFVGVSHDTALVEARQWRGYRRGLEIVARRERAGTLSRYGDELVPSAVAEAMGKLHESIYPSWLPKADEVPQVRVPRPVTIADDCPEAPMVPGPTTKATNRPLVDCRLDTLEGVVDILLRLVDEHHSEQLRAMGYTVKRTETGFRFEWLVGPDGQPHRPPKIGSLKSDAPVTETLEPRSVEFAPEGSDPE